MNTKLILSIDKTIIENAKKNLQTRKKSLSKSIVSELTGIAKISKKTKKKEIIADYLLKKYA